MHRLTVNSYLSSDARSPFFHQQASEQSNSNFAELIHVMNPSTLVTRLFRREALENVGVRTYGTVILARPLSATVLTSISVLLAAGVVLFFALCGYTRKAQVPGVILPNRGVVRVVPSQTGVVGERRVREGQSVKAGDVLFILTSERASATRGAAESTISGLMQARRISLQTELAQQQQQSTQRMAAAKRRIADLSTEMGRIDDQRVLQARRVSLAEESVKRNADLQAANFISAAALQDRTAELLDQQQRMGDLIRANAATARDLAGVQADLRDLVLQAQRDQQVAQRSIAAIDQDITENEARRQVYVRAPQDGVVTGITAGPGQTVIANQTLATVLPTDADLVAELYVPSRSAGFIRPGMEVMLRYQAYSYQKFGHQQGRVRDVSDMALRLDELPLPIASANPGEPFYRVRVDLNRQTVQAYGTAQPLRPGMALEASVLLERRKLYEWVLDPLYSISGRV
jgi:membrane fusion protein